MITKISPLLIITLVLFACKSDKCIKGLYKQYSTLEKAYHGNDRLNAEKALIEFNQFIIKNRDCLEANGRNTNHMLAVNWLRIYNVRSSINDASAESALNSAIGFFDTLPEMTEDAIYTRNKKEAMLLLIKAMESRKTTEWASVAENQSKAATP